MANRTISENINQAISDFKSIKQAIIDKGVEIPEGTPTSEYGAKIEGMTVGGLDTSRITNFSNFFESTGYGTGGGLCGWNCRHNFIPFNPKYMSNNLKQYGLEENKESYELSQKQRIYERRIRNTKRKISTIKSSLNISSNEQLNKELNIKLHRSERLLKKQNKNYNEFCSSHSLIPLKERLKVPINLK